MEKFVSVWADGKTLPESYIFPPDQRPGDLIGPTYSKKSIPVIDMNKASSHGHLVELIMEATQEFGAFQVINHGVSRQLMDETRDVFKEFFQHPVEENVKFCSNDDNKKFHLYTSANEYETESLHFWRDVLRIQCTPLEECMAYWPQTPPQYREVVGEYVMKVNQLGSRLMEMLCEGLELEPRYFVDKLKLEAHLMVNHYPPCPDPRLTLGVGRHSDRTLITILMQDVPGLQILNNGDWIDVEPIPDAFVVNIGCITQVISNGKLKSGDHRVVTNAYTARESVSMFILPESNCYIEPAKSLVNAKNPAIYKSFMFQEFLISHAKRTGIKRFRRYMEAFSHKLIVYVQVVRNTPRSMFSYEINMLYYRCRAIIFLHKTTIGPNIDPLTRNLWGFICRQHFSTYAVPSNCVVNNNNIFQYKYN